MVTHFTASRAKMPTQFAHEHHLAELSVQRASALTKQVLRSITDPSNSFSKAASTPVIIADFAAQALLISAIHAAFPNDRFVGESADALRSDPDLCQKVWELVKSTRLEHEESEGLLAGVKSVEELFGVIDLGGTGTGGGEGKVWMLDPIDGTATFQQG